MIYRHDVHRQQQRATEIQISELIKTYKGIKFCENNLRTIGETQEK